MGGIPCGGPIITIKERSDQPKDVNLNKNKNIVKIDLNKIMNTKHSSNNNIDNENIYKKETKKTNLIDKEIEPIKIKDNNNFIDSMKKIKKKEIKETKEIEDKFKIKEIKFKKEYIRNDNKKERKNEINLFETKEKGRIHKENEKKEKRLTRQKKRITEEKTFAQISKRINDLEKEFKEDNSNNSVKESCLKLSLNLIENQDIKDFYLLDTYESIKDKKTYKIEDNIELIVIYYYKRKSEFHRGLYKKKEFLKTYELICIDYNVNLGFLFPKYKYNDKFTEKDIMNELKDSLCRRRIEEIFGIKLKSKTKNFYLKKVTNNNYKSFILLCETNIFIPKKTIRKNIDNNSNSYKKNNLINIDNNTITVQKKNKNNDIINNQKNDNDNEISNQNNKNNNDDNKIIIKTNKPNDNIKKENTIQEQIKNNNNSKKIEDEFTTPGNNIEIINKIEKSIIKIIDNNNFNSNASEKNTNNTNKNNNSIDGKKDENDINNIIFSNETIKFDNNQKKLYIQNNIINIINIPYFFPLIGLNNLGSTCFMNATLQCLIHVQELSLYFLNEYPKDKEILNSRNISSETQGRLSEVYYYLIKNIENISLYTETKKSNYFYLKQFHQTLGVYNPQFAKNEANDSKDLITYLLQSFHSELNYFGDKSNPNYLPLPDSSNRILTYNHFIQDYNIKNLSKISQIFYGTYENITTCLDCKTKFYSYQKFEIISFSTYFYKNKEFKIMQGFKDNESTQYLFGDNKYFCNKCIN